MHPNQSFITKMSTVTKVKINVYNTDVLSLFYLALAISGNCVKRNTILCLKHCKCKIVLKIFEKGYYKGKKTTTVKLPFLVRTSQNIRCRISTFSPQTPS